MSSKKKSKNATTGSDATQQGPVGPPSHFQRRQNLPRQERQDGQPYQQPSAASSSRQRSAGFASRLRRSPLLPLVVVAVIALLPSLYFYHRANQAEHKATTPTSTNLQTTAEVVKRVSRHILLPSGEQPTVATVSDASKVRSQAFFANAASGDKVLVYAQAKKAYLYRPSIDRIIEVAPLAPNTTTP